jgi:hypothetical protein
MNWALTKKKLSPDTLKIYLSDLKLAHKIRSVEPNFENDFFIKAMLKGAKNCIPIYQHHQKIQIRHVIPVVKNHWPQNRAKHLAQG